MKKFRRLLARPLTGSAAMLMALPLATQAPAAELVFQADFNGEGGLTGGPRDIVTVGGTATLHDRDFADAQVVTGDDIGDGGGGFLRVVRSPGTSSGVAAVRFTAGSGNWADSWYTNDGSNDQLHGALDFFYRQSTDLHAASTFRYDLGGFTGDGATQGLRIRVESGVSNDGTKTMVLDVDQRDGEATTNHLGEVSGTVALTADTLYHMALVTTPVGTNETNFSFYLKEGNTAIRPGDDTPLMSLTLQIDPDGTLESTFLQPATLRRLGLNAGVFNSLYEGEDPLEESMYFEYDQFRIYQGVPDELTALPEPSAGMMLSIAAGGLALVRRTRK